MYGQDCLCLSSALCSTNFDIHPHLLRSFFALLGGFDWWKAVCVKKTALCVLVFLLGKSYRVIHLQLKCSVRTVILFFFLFLVVSHSFVLMWHSECDLTLGKQRAHPWGMRSASYGVSNKFSFPDRKPTLKLCIYFTGQTIISLANHFRPRISGWCFLRNVILVRTDAVMHRAINRCKKQCIRSDPSRA